jgi:hypothetical protein
MFNQYEEMMNDPALDEWEEEEAMWERDFANELLSEINDYIKDKEVRSAELSVELSTWKTTRDEAATFLAEAEEARARQALAAKDAEFEAFKDQYNVMKSEYDELYAYDMAGTIDETQFERMLELEELYYEDQEIYEQFERERVQSLRDNQEKEYNNSKMALERVQADVTAIEREQTNQTEMNTANAEIQSDLEVEIAQLELDLKSLRGDEKDAMKDFIKNEGFKLDNARLAVKQGNKALIEIADRLATANDLLADAQADFNAK